MLTVTMKDLKTGQIVTKTSDANVIWWTDGNGSCDCIRALAFPPKVDQELEAEYGAAFCFGAKRFIVVDVEGDLEGWDKDKLIAKMNRRYRQ